MANWCYCNTSGPTIFYFFFAENQVLVLVTIRMSLTFNGPALELEVFRKIKVIAKPVPHARSLWVFELV